jgi:hypothetical protein
MIHRHYSDPLFCGVIGTMRRFTFNVDELTCDSCITYSLSDRGKQTLLECGYDEHGAIIKDTLNSK